jgi:GH24 family phage-related lysozyme (muramidase)
MRAPILQGYGGTKPSKQGLSYLSDAGATPEAFGAGIGRALGGLGDSLVEAGLQYDKRNEKTARFGALIGLSEFQTQTAAELTELKRTVPPDVKDFPAQVDAFYAKKEQAYLASLPPQLQPEFTYRARQIKQGVMGDAFQFQYTQQDAFYVEGINKEYERAKNGVFATPGEFDKWSAHVAEVITASDLPTAEKARLAREMDQGLRAVLYGKEVEGVKREAPQITGDFQQGARQLLYKFENSPDKVWTETHWDVDHWRIGYSSDTITMADGTVREVQRGDKITKEDAERDLSRRINVAANEGARKMGQDTWNKLGGAAQAALVSVIYNYGHLPPSVATAAQTGDMEKLASAVQGLSSNKDRRRQEADIIRGSSGIEQQAVMEEINADPRFANIPLEDRLAIEAGAQTKVNQEVAAATKAATEAANAARNSLFVGLHDGTYDEADIQAARNSGMLTDVDDIEKAEKILGDRKEGISDQAFIAAAAAAGGAGYGTGDNERWNKAFESSGGRAQIAARNDDYFNTGVLPHVQALQDIPTDLVGQLTTMARSSDPEALLWAYGRLSDLEGKALDAYNDRVDRDLAAKVDQYNYAKGYLPDDALADYLRGGPNQDDQRVAQQKDAEATSILANPETKAGKYVVDPGRLVNGWWDFQFGTPGAATFTDQTILSNEFKAAFKFNYRIAGNEADALDLTRKQLERVWGVNDWGETGEKFMRLPPDKAGYKPQTRGFLETGVQGVIENPWEHYEADIRNSYGITSDEQFFLRSDGTTGQEFEASQSGALNRLPSYRVFKITEGGQTIEVSTPMTRWWGAQ